MAINPKIKQKAEDIRKKIFGAEVRESLASGLEGMSEDVESIKGRQGNVENQFQDVLDETTGKDVINGPEVIAARNGEANLKTRLDKEKQEVTAQLQQIVTINVKSFGAVADADFFNPTDNKYYSDANFTKPATNNNTVFTSILNYMNANGWGSFTVFFPKGNYYSSRALETSGENIIIEGSMAKLITSVSDSSKEISCVYARDCKTFKCHGMTFENIIENKGVSSSLQGRYYHIWIRESATKNLEYCNIFDNVFIDKVSIPNTTIKPYNGSVYVTNGKNIFIHDNKFYNNCGRVVYISGCENVNIHDNQLENIGYIPTEITNVKVGTLIFRVLSSRNVKIHHNIVNGTNIYNPKQISVYGLFAGMNEGLEVTTENVTFDNNTINVNNSNMDVVRLSSVINSSVSNNEVILGKVSPRGTFIREDPLNTETYMKALNIKVNNNKIYNSHVSTIGIATVYTSEKMVLILSNNQYDSDVNVDKIGDFGNLTTLNNNAIKIMGDFITQNGIFKKGIKGASLIDYNSHPFPFALQITGGNLSTYLDVDGILNVPSGYNVIEFNVFDVPDIAIYDIKIDGNYQARKELTFTHLAGVLPNFVNRSSTMRMSGGSFTMIDFQSVKFKRGASHWFRVY